MDRGPQWMPMVRAALWASGPVALLGLAVMIGWWAQLPLLVQLQPGLVPVQFNTGLGFLLTGIGIFTLARGAHRPSE